LRLLDQIMSGPVPLHVEQRDGRQFRLTSAGDFAAQLAACPLRYVLRDELTRTCAALACSDGLSLMNCLELARLPAEQLWIEWRDGPRQQELARVFPHLRGADAGLQDLQAGALLQCDRSGRRGQLRTFWSAPDTDCDPRVSPIITHFDFDTPAPQARSIEGLFQGEAVAIDVASDCEAELVNAEAGLSSLLAYLRFRLDGPWLEYYRTYAADPAARAAVLRICLGSVATDMPMLIAFALLLHSRNGLAQQASDLARLNRSRLAKGKRALLEHVEVGLPLALAGRRGADAPDAWSRNTPRLHHVRGHLVRRADHVFWRSPHWRGALRLGQVRSRTVAVGL
jgi:hypothetical protein